ncbi:MAG TPA: MFS transporter [Phycisphaerales bacterium]|nr:MFS transporter [Phycisphaerales bacterium]
MATDPRRLGQGIDTVDPDHNVPPAGFEPPGDSRTLLGHPLGLYLLFFVEMWERFSYYGMRAILVLYLARSASPSADQNGFVNPGRGWDESNSYTLYGWYTGLAYLTPVLGGMIADKIIGTHRSMIVGGLTIALGHLVLFVSGLGSFATNHTGMTIFITGLALIVLGTGHFKPTVSVMVSQLYPDRDRRRENAFSIFYMGINLGALLGTLLCGYLGEKIGWHFGFGAAAVGMIAGLITYIFGRPFLLKRIGLPPEGKPNISLPLIGTSLVLAAGVGGLYHFGALGAVGDAISWLKSPENKLIGIGVALTLVGVVLGLAMWLVSLQRPGDKGPVVTILVFMLFNAMFWLAFEQAGSTLTIFAERSTARTMLGWEVPASWFQFINPAVILLCTPLFALLWTRLDRVGRCPSQPTKIAMGLVLVGLGYVFLVIAARNNHLTGELVSPMWLVALFIVHTWGEICLSPTGLSYVTKTAPIKFMSLLMGIWFLSSFVANLSAGLVATLVEPIEKGRIKLPWSIGGRADFFMFFVVSSVGAGVLILILVPLLKKLMRNPND